MFFVGPVNQYLALNTHEETTTMNRVPTATGVKLNVLTFKGYATGSEKKTVIVDTQRTAIQLAKTPYLPRLKGPGTNELPANANRKKIGNPYAMYSAIVAIETMASNATRLTKDCKIKMN